MSASMPLISVALCTYNGAVYLGEQLETILSQTYSNLEIIVADDCSTDSTWHILTRYALMDSRIKIFKNTVNLGFNKNFEKTISLASGNFIALSDQDDLWYPNKIEELYNAIGDNWIVFSNSELINSTGNLLDSSLLKDFQFSDQKYNSLLLNNYVTGHTTLINRVSLSCVLPIPERGFYDWWLGFIALYHNKLGYLDKVLTKYRVHANSVINTSIKESRIKNRRESTLILQLNSFLDYPQLSKVDKKYITGIYNSVKAAKAGNSWPLYRLIIFQYPVLFSHKKSRGFTSRLNFARKFIRTI
ncbi:glycosyltransferase [Flavihumibacter sp. R14]|nr:glycosyltransferase [Flavihumibacter soli]